LKQAKSENKIEMLTKHWVIVSDLLPLTYWYWYENDIVRSLDHRHPTDRNL